MSALFVASPCGVEDDVLCAAVDARCLMDCCRRFTGKAERARDVLWRPPGPEDSVARSPGPRASGATYYQSRWADELSSVPRDR
jgi:hypothetical protein